MAVLRELMRHESIETAMRFYVGQNAKATADECWRVVESEEKNGVADLDFKWTEAGSNRRHMDFQSIALPTELPVQTPTAAGISHESPFRSDSGEHATKMQRSRFHEKHPAAVTVGCGNATPLAELYLHQF